MLECDVVLHVQITVSMLQRRQFHSATAISLSPGLVEVILFGGTYLAKTTVLRFGKCVSCKAEMCVCFLCTCHFSIVVTLSMLGSLAT